MSCEKDCVADTKIALAYMVYGEVLHAEGTGELPPLCHIINLIYTHFKKYQMERLCKKYGEDKKEMYEETIDNEVCYFFSNVVDFCQDECHAKGLKPYLKVVHDIHMYEETFYFENNGF